MTSDSFLIQEIRSDNRLAFTIVYDKYHRELYAFAFRYTRDGILAEDIVQHTYLKLWESRKNLNPSLSLRSYMYRIAKNYTLNCIRNYNTATLKNEEYCSMMAELAVDHAVESERRDVVSLLNGAIGKLSPQKMAVCRMKMDEGCSNREIADKLGISVNTVKVLYNQSIKQLRLLMHISYVR